MIIVSALVLTMRMLILDLQMRNESLWFVKAEERTVFDLVQEFALPETSE